VDKEMQRNAKKCKEKVFRVLRINYLINFFVIKEYTKYKE